MDATAYFVIAIIASTLEKGHAAIMSQPQDMASVSGSDVKFNCSISDTTPTTWAHTRPGSTVRTTIFLSLENKVNNPEKHDVTGRYDLTVKTVAPYDGGMYYCKVFTDPPVEIGAKLYVFEPLSCGTRQAEIVEGDNVTMFCASVYGGETQPDLQFSGATSDMVTMVTKGANSTSQFITTETSTIVTSEDNGRQVTCHVTLASPEYSENCTVTMSVLYHSKNITILPAHDHFYVGEQIRCMAEGNPEPSLSWENQNKTEETVPGDTLTVTSQMMGNNTWRCLATNTINGTTNSSYLEISFHVGEGERTTPGPVSSAVMLNSTLLLSLLLVFIPSFLIHNRNPNISI